MKTKDKASYRAMKPEELVSTVRELRKKLSDFQLSRTTREVKNLREGKALRQRLTVALTMLKEKETHE